MSDRDIDVVVFGATSVTGRRVASYLAERAAETGLRWAAAARDLAKLEHTMSARDVRPPEVLAADVEDPASLAAMASRAGVVVNLVGPYTRQGTPVIEACVAAGAHYIDLTGEIPFVRRTIDAFDAAATRAGVKVVQAGGFEALPPDLAVALAAEAARERWGERLTEADVEVAVLRLPRGLPRPSDLVSGGTLQSMIEITADPDAKGTADPAKLVTDEALAARIRAVSPIALAPRRGAGGSVVAPMAPAAFINPAVIHRSAALRAAELGESPLPLRYREGIALGGHEASLPLRYAAAGIAAGFQVGLGAIARTGAPVRGQVGRAMRAVLPGSGFGPREERLEGWRWGLAAHARTQSGRAVEVELEADGHPGYLTTARMLGESGLLLTEPEATPPSSGCLTPAAALGTRSIERFERAGMRFSVR